MVRIVKHMIKVRPVVPNNILNICVIFFIGFVLISCDQLGRYGTKNQPNMQKVVDKQTLVTMVEQLHQVLNVKDYTVDKGMRVLKPYLSTHKICIPGFSKIAPYDESYLYVYCIYDTKETPPRVLSFRFELPKQLAQQLNVKDISKPFKTWQLEHSVHTTDSRSTNRYNAGGKNLSISLVQEAQPNQTDSIVTEVIVYH